MSLSLSTSLSLSSSSHPPPPPPPLAFGGWMMLLLLWVFGGTKKDILWLLLRNEDDTDGCLSNARPTTVTTCWGWVYSGCRTLCWVVLLLLLLLLLQLSFCTRVPSIHSLIWATTASVPARIPKRISAPPQGLPGLLNAHNKFHFTPRELLCTFSHSRSHTIHTSFPVPVNYPRKSGDFNAGFTPKL